MANMTLIIGESGTGKSSGIRNLDPKETFVINILDKPLPFRSFYTNYIRPNKLGDVSNPGVNYCASDKVDIISSVIKRINDSRPDIKILIIDDFQYIMGNEFMRRAKERGFDKFTEIGQNAWGIIYQCIESRRDLFVFILSHNEMDDQGRSKIKTVGKILDRNITLEGMFTTVLHSVISDGKYKFITQNDGCLTAKSPFDLFDDLAIDNDISLIKDKMSEYFGKLPQQSTIGEQANVTTTAAIQNS